MEIKWLGEENNSTSTQVELKQMFVQFRIDLLSIYRQYIKSRENAGEMINVKEASRQFVPNKKVEKCNKIKWKKLH